MLVSRSRTHFVLPIFQKRIPAPKSDRLLVASDYATTYQATTDITRNGPRTSESIAVFERGKMPTGGGLVFGWGMPEAYCLAFHLLSEGPKAYSGDVLESALIPERMTLAATSRKLVLKAQVAEINSGVARKVLFWGQISTDGSRSTGKDNAQELLGELVIEGSHAGLPTKIRFTTFSIPAPEMKISEYVFDGTFVPTDNTLDLAADIAYDSDVTVIVIDRRLEKEVDYTLAPGARVPFRGTPEYTRMLSRAESSREYQDHLSIVTKVIRGLIVSTLVFFGFWIFVVRKSAIKPIR